jgi:hypothetical protein
LTGPPPGLRFVPDPDLSRVARLMQASWAAPCWIYDVPLLEYYLRRPSVARDLLLGLEDDATGELVAYYAFMPLSLVERANPRRAVFGSFLTAAAPVRRTGAARAVQVRLLEEAMARGYEEYLAFCSAGAFSNDSIARSCDALGLATRKVASVPYLALPASVVARRARPASGTLRRYGPGDATAAVALLAERPTATIEARHDPRDLHHRLLAPVGRTYVWPRTGGCLALAHFALLEVYDGGRRFRNAYLRDFETGNLSERESEQFLADILRAVAGEGCHLVIAPGTASSPVASLVPLGFRPVGRPLNLLWTRLGDAAPARPTSAAALRLEVF